MFKFCCTIFIFIIAIQACNNANNNNAKSNQISVSVKKVSDSFYYRDYMQNVTFSNNYAANLIKENRFADALFFSNQYISYLNNTFNTDTGYLSLILNAESKFQFYKEKFQYYYTLSDIQSICKEQTNAINSIKKCIALNNSDTFNRFSYLRLANYFMHGGQVDSAVIYYLKTKDYCAKFKDTSNALLVNNNLSSLYVNYFRDTVKFAAILKEQNALTENPKFSVLSLYYSNVGVIHMHMNRLTSAITYFNKALYIYNKNQNNYQKTTTKTNIFLGLCKVYAKLGNEKMFLQHQDSLLNLTIEPNRKKRFVTLNAAYCYQFLGKFHKSNELCEQFLNDSVMNADAMYTEEVLELLITNNEKIGDFKNAYFYLRKHIDIQQQRQINEKEMQVSQLEKQYEVNKNKLVVKEKDEIILKQNQKILLTTLISALLLFIVIVFFIVRNNRNNKKIQQKQLEFSQKILSNQEAERAGYAADIHDSVGYELISILQCLKNNNLDQAKISVKNSMEIVRNMARNMHPVGIENAGLKKTIETMMQKVEDVNQILVSVDVDDIDLNPNTAIMIYRLIQEMVNNTIKHAQATAIKCEINNLGNILELIYQDNGKGYDTKQVAKQKFGLFVIEQRAKILHAKVSLNAEIGAGVNYKIVFPI